MMNDRSQDLAVIFDMDGVLVDTYHAHYRSWLAMAEPEGLSFTEQEFAAGFGRTSREIIAFYWGEGRKSEREMAAMDKIKEAEFRRLITQEIPAMPGVAELLKSLRGAGFKLAVGSSAPPENVNFVLDGLKIRSMFDAVITGGDVLRGKPDPQVFLLAAQRIGLSPRQCAVVEDAPPGVAAAKAAGMAAVGLCSTGRKPEDLVEADTVVDSLGELSPEFFRDLILGKIV
jgi:beta-phosphoglucomutase